MILYGMLLRYREVPLKEKIQELKLNEPGNIHLVVEKSKYRLSLYSGSRLIKSYKAVFGKNLYNNRNTKFLTPTGEYRIEKIIDNYKYYKLLKLNYPNKRDAAEALKEGKITKSEFEKYFLKLDDPELSADSSSLGTNIGIQGIGEFNYIFRNLPFAFNWTNGSIALSNEDIDELLTLVEVGTPVSIKE